MVARKFIVHHEDFSSHVDYDTDDGFEVFKFQLSSLTSVPPDRQKIVGGRNGGDCIITDDSDLAVVSEELKLVSIEGEDEEKAKEEEQPSGAGATLLSDEEVNLMPIEGEDEEKATEEEQPSGADATLMSDEELARMLQAEEEALMLQHFAVSEQGGHIEGRIRPYITQVCMYEDPVRQEAARKTVPVDELEEKAMVSLAKIFISEDDFDDLFSRFSNEFSNLPKCERCIVDKIKIQVKGEAWWVTAPPCDACGNDTINQGMGKALPSEIQYGATRVEIYRCNACSRITRFPRYNDPLKLVETRRGRCGEWGNCFTLYCRAFGYESRLVLDFTDHVWTECFSEYLGRWMHLDPCEGVYDKPLLYEKGWNKKLNYVFAIAIDGVYDVTKQYTREWLQVLSRRNIATEPVLLTALTNMTKDCRGNLTSQILTKLEERDKNELEALERDLYSTDDALVLLPGRESGDREWRIARSEIGSAKNQSLGCSSCPLRACVDEHVTRIYNAFFSVLSQFVKNSFPQSKVLDILKFVKGVFVDLKKSPYRTRKVSINPFALHWVQYFDDLLDALSLKSEIDADGKVNICLADESVKTALALPVALDAIVGVINYLNNCDSLDLNSLSLPMMSNRIHSGSVLASGEELPFGIATSAFDGLQSSKWEEPNGARGGWLLYKLPDGHMHKLVAYDVVSANDATSWIVEGSEDGGSTWHVLDKQTSQFFEKRFQCKSLEIKAGHVLCNIFRFRFLSVRDVNLTSRLQLSSINLYTDASSS